MLHLPVTRTKFESLAKQRQGMHRRLASTTTQMLSSLKRGDVKAINEFLSASTPSSAAALNSWTVVQPISPAHNHAITL